jgi:tetratricopeptide (TPR) repeat protein
MADDAIAEGAKYWAFISYSHKDAAFGRRLHRHLESYSLPGHLVGRKMPFGVLPKRLSPIFRDHEELPAANDLSTEVQAALQASRSLVVVCSPAAAVSVWVAREIELFRALHPDRPVLAAIREGDLPECLPQALRQVGADGKTIEPLAANFRRGYDGVRLGVLKLVAGVVGVGLGELLQRDSHRRLQRVTVITVAALIAMLVMGALTTLALTARTEAERQRTEAEGLVEFMLTDLRDRLKGVGRLDLMAAVNQRALKYYGDQSIDRLPALSLERRARILHAMGEDDEARGDYDAALTKFREANRTTAALLAESPNDPDRIYTHAQTEFWIGTVYYERNQRAASASSFQAYKQLTDRLVAIAPDNPKYLREAGFAENNLCIEALEKPRDLKAAVRYCGNSLTDMKEAARHLGPASGVADDLINAHAWLADAYYYSGDLVDAKSERLEEEQILDKQIAADHKNMDLRDTWVTMQRALALIEAQSGNKPAALARLSRALATVQSMIQFDPKNQRWNEDRALIEKNLSTLH